MKEIYYSRIREAKHRFRVINVPGQLLQASGDEYSKHFAGVKSDDKASFHEICRAESNLRGTISQTPDHRQPKLHLFFHN